MFQRGLVACAPETVAQEPTKYHRRAHETLGEAAPDDSLKDLQNYALQVDKPSLLCALLSTGVGQQMAEPDMVEKLTEAVTNRLVATNLYSQISVHSIHCP